MEWTVSSERIVHERLPWLRIREQDVILPDGEMLHDYVLLDERDGCLVFAVTRGGQAILLEQYRHGRGEREIGLPSGYLESGDADPLETAKRELLEETGYRTDDWMALGALFTNSNRGRQVFHFYLALDATKVAPPALESGEVGAVVRLMPAQGVEAWLGRVNGDVGMAATAGILLALASIRKGER